jgi:hypothetical protein
MSLADPVPDSNGVAHAEKPKVVKPEELPPRPKSALTETPSLSHTSDSESTNRLAVPQDRNLTTTTSATSESDAAPGASPKPKKKIIRVRRKKKVDGEPKLNGSEPKLEDSKLNGSESKIEDLKPATSVTKINHVEKKATEQTEVNTSSLKEEKKEEEKAEDGEVKPEKKIVRKKKKVVTDEEPKLNGTETEDANPAPKPVKSEEEPQKVFSRSRLYGAAK